MSLIGDDECTSRNCAKAQIQAFEGLVLEMNRQRDRLLHLQMVFGHGDERCKPLVKGASRVDQDREECDLVTKIRHRI